MKRFTAQDGSSHLIPTDRLEHIPTDILRAAKPELEDMGDLEDLDSIANYYARESIGHGPFTTVVLQFAVRIGATEYVDDMDVEIASALQDDDGWIASKTVVEYIKPHLDLLPLFCAEVRRIGGEPLRANYPELFGV